MARPTNDPKKENIRVRINGEQAEWCQANGGYTKVIRRLLDEAMGKISENKKDDSVTQILECEKDRLKPQIEGFKWDFSDDSMRDIEQMVKLTGGNLRGLIDDLRAKMESGEIRVADGEIETADECPFNWQNMVEVCKNAGIEPDKAVDKFIQMMYRGMV